MWKVKNFVTTYGGKRYEHKNQHGSYAVKLLR